MSETTKTTSNINYNQAISEWDDPTLDLRPSILRGIFAYGFEKPSPIQKKGLIPLVQPGCTGKRRDILAQAQSGTGTLSEINNQDYENCINNCMEGCVGDTTEELNDCYNTCPNLCPIIFPSGYSANSN